MIFDGSKKCDECGYLNPYDAIFCNDCGAKLPNVCVFCGYVNDPDADFCISCGALLKKAVEELAHNLTRVTSSGQDAGRFIDLAYDANMAGRYDEGRQYAFNAALLEPGNYLAYCNQAFALLRSNRPKDAAVLYRKAAEMEPTDPITYTMLGQALTNTGQYTDAIDMFRKVAEMAPDNAGNYDSWGFCLTSMGNYKAALPLLEKALELDPEMATAYQNMAHALHHLGKNEEALEISEKGYQTVMTDEIKEWADFLKKELAAAEEQKQKDFKPPEQTDEGETGEEDFD
ncbi:MAG: tetratricopeptide repeat protein [Candidatus Coatesbacteria bacterium]|nr:MAG: tetratricopeptide repeat protein [Candidatus Coatesbacteria bacterium]